MGLGPLDHLDSSRADLRLPRHICAAHAWTMGIRRREPRPQRYAFLDHLSDRPGLHNCAEPSPSALPLDGASLPWDRKPRPIVISSQESPIVIPSREAPGQGSDAEDEAENMPLQIVQEGLDVQ